MSGFSSNQNGSSSRRTISSPYLGAVLNRNRAQKGPSPPLPKGTSATTNQNRNDLPRGARDSAAPPRGSRSAPPHVGHPGIHEYLERKAGIQKEIKRNLLKSRLDKLIDYQAMISSEIDSLERDFELAMESPPPRYSRAASQSEPKTRLKYAYRIATSGKFRVVGGCPGNLVYKINKKPGRDGKIRSFSLEVDVKGYSSENIEVDTEETTMSIKATKVNGSKKDLKVVAPTVKDMEKAYVHPPRFGLLVIDF